MNIKYWYEFKGLDEVLNRVEILTQNSTTTKEIKGAATPFVLEYIKADKLEPVQGSQTTLRMISQLIFQFIDLHTDDMQEYVIKFYRGGRLYWIGFLDSELYNEQLTDYPPYVVEFSGADFNILKRLKYRDAVENAYTDIAPLITHLKRCFDALGLPFNKLYIGCTTEVNGVTTSAGETPLHVLHMMSSNFYDEDNEPMTCREVVESILRPFGLMMAQKDTNVYIYDYNTIKQGLPMKRYDFSTWAYEVEETVNFNLGNLSDIGFMSTDSSYGFEEMINNVKITSSLYGKATQAEAEIEEDKLSDKVGAVQKEGYVLDTYKEAENIVNVGSIDYLVYKKDGSNNTLKGASMAYDYNPASLRTICKISSADMVSPSSGNYFLNVKVQTYINTRTNPFDTEEKSKVDQRSVAIRLYCNLYVVDEKDKPLLYYNNTTEVIPGWKPASDGRIEQGKFCLMYYNNTTESPGSDPSPEILDKWMTNVNQFDTKSSYPFLWIGIVEKYNGDGVDIGLATLVDGSVTGVVGRVVFEVTNKCLIDNPGIMSGFDPFPKENVTNILLNNFSLNLRGVNKKAIPTDDYEFKSYVNKKVATDFEDITLKCISANEEEAPVGKANMLAKTGNTYKLQLSFTRAGQTDILERLLMCTIHSNYSQKNVKISSTIALTANPILTYCTYENVIQSDGMIITGARIDFYDALATITAVGYSDDVAKLSSIPYD